MPSIGWNGRGPLIGPLHLSPHDRVAKPAVHRARENVGQSLLARSWSRPPFVNPSKRGRFGKACVPSVSSPGRRGALGHGLSHQQAGEQKVPRGTR